MKSVKAFKWVAVAAAATIGVLSSFTPASAVDFEAAEVDQSNFISVAIPAGTLVPYKLWLIRATQPGANCFAVSGDNPGIVAPLWQTTSGCGAGFDSNAYSIRVGGGGVAIAICAHRARKQRGTSAHRQTAPGAFLCHRAYRGHQPRWLYGN